jgi:hypothetical protein
MLKKTVLILMSLIIIFSLTGSASAKKPEPTYCEMFWLRSDPNEWPSVWVEGKMTYNETAQVYNISCRYEFDFDSGEWVDFATMCSELPWACNPSQTMFKVNGLGWYSDFAYTVDTTYLVSPNGQAKFFAQYAPEQCQSEYKSVSYTYLPLEEWTPGTHTYQFTEISEYGVYPSDPVEFTVDKKVWLLDSNVRLGYSSLSSDEGILDPYTINPKQETYIQDTFLNAINIEELEWVRKNMTVQLVIDGGDPIDLQPGPIVNYCSASNDGAYEREWGYVR